MDFQQLLILKNQPPRQGTKVFQRPLIRRICLCYLQHCGADTADAAASAALTSSAVCDGRTIRATSTPLLATRVVPKNGKSFSI